MAEEFDAFISYSRVDRVFSELLEQSLEGFKPPPDLAVPQHPLKVFRDVSDLTGNQYFRAIESQLRASSKMIVVCTPDARRSDFVEDELRRFIEARGALHVIPILLGGVPNNEASADQAELMAFPRALTDALEFPLAIDYRGWSPSSTVDDGVHRAAWYTLLADLYGVTRDQIEARDAVRRARDRVVVSRQAATAARRALATEPELAVALATYAVNVTRIGDGTVTSESEETLHLAVEAFQRRRTIPQLVLRGHQDAVWDIQYSPDGSTLVTSSEDGSWRLWNAESGDEITAVFGTPPHGVVKKARFSSDGQNLITAHLDGRAKHWTPGRASSVSLEASCWAVAYSPTGESVATADLDGLVRVWSVTTGELLHRFALAGPAVTVDFSPDGKRLAAAGKFGMARIWILDPEQRELSLEGHTEVVHSIAFSPDGKLVATGSEDATWRLWDANSGKPLKRVDAIGRESARPGEKSIAAVAFNPGGSLLATACRDKSATIWNLRSGREQLTLAGHSGGVWGAAFHPTREQLATCSYDRTSWIWNVSAHSDLLLRLEGDDEITSLVFDPQGSQLYAGSQNGRLSIWNVGTGARLREQRARGTVSALAFHRGARTVITAEGDGTVGLWDVAGNTISDFKAHAESVVSVGLNPDETRLLTAAFKGEVKIWEWGSMKLLHSFHSGADELRAAAFSPDGEIIATAASGHEWAPTSPSNSTIRLWNRATLEPTLTLEGHERPLMSIAFSPRGTTLVSASHDHTARLWDVKTGRQLAVLASHVSRLNAVSFSPDGSRLATAGADRVVKLWRTGSKADAVTLPGHVDQVMCVGFSPDGKWLASGARDGTVLLHRPSVDTLLPLAEKAIPKKLTDEEVARYIVADS